MELVSRDDIRKRLVATGGKVVQSVEDRQMFKAESRDAKSKLELMKDLKKMVTDGNKKTAADVSQAGQVYGELSKLSRKSNEIKGKLRKVEAESRCRLIRLNHLSVQQTIMYKAMHGVIEQSVSIFIDFGNWLGSERVKSFRDTLAKAYYDNLIECPMARLTFPGLMLPARPGDLVERR